MARVTYYVALPFIRDADGTLVPEKAAAFPDAQTAINRARSLAVTHPGAVAFSRTGDFDLDEFEPLEILAVFGDVPEELSEM